MAMMSEDEKVEEENPTNVVVFPFLTFSFSFFSFFHFRLHFFFFLHFCLKGYKGGGGNIIK